MPLTASFYWIKEDTKPESQRVFHRDSSCVRGRDINQYERNVGTGGYRLCEMCRALDDEEPPTDDASEKDLIIKLPRRRRRM
jgi:hypothetical protein